MREKLNLILLFLTLALGFGLRLYKLDIPLADHHSWRQADTAAVARNFAKDHWDFFKPRIDNMTPLHLGTPNSERLFMVEPPVYNSIVAGVYKIFGIEIRYARLVSIAFSLGAMVFLYLIVSHFLGKTTGLLSAFFFAVLPFSVYYSRVVLPEPMILFLTLGMFWFAIKWLATDSNKDYLLLTAFSALSFTQKTFPLFFLLPLAYLFLKKFGLSAFKQKKLYFWALLSLVPFVAWRWWVGQFPEGTPANFWLFNQGNIRFKGAFFHWIFAKRIGELILGFWGVALLVLGLVLKPKKEGLFFYSWLLAIFIYITVFAAGNVTHDYYQIPLIPILAVFLGKGANFLLFEKQEKFSRIMGVAAFVICTGLACAFSWYEVRGFYNIQSGVDLAGVAVGELTAKNALVLTGDSNDATLLYNTNRWGWTGGYASSFPNSKETIEKIKELGGTIYVTTKFDKNSDFGKYMNDNYQVLKETDQYIIFDLNNKETNE